MITPDKYFYCNNGTVLKTLEELKSEIEKNCESYNLENFYFHVNNERNDYSDWIRGVFKNEALSKSLLDKKDPSSFLKTLNTHLESEKEITKTPTQKEKQEDTPKKKIIILKKKAKTLKKKFKNLLGLKKDTEPNPSENAQVQEKEKIMIQINNKRQNRSNY